MHTSSLRRTPRRRRGALIASPALFAAAVVALAACSSSASNPGNSSGGGLYGNAAPSKGSAPASSGTALALRSTSLGTILTDARGFTLYAFEADKGATSSCSGACAMAWPPVAASGTASQVGTGITSSLVGQITRTDGTRQLTYAGHPVYGFVGDTAAGSTNGQGKTAFGARWDVLTATGHEVTTLAHNPSAAPKPSATTGGGVTNGIPQNGGGDGDGDNSGGPSDGDGNV
jgi:predicted lipoprotein with Yx(FWY)xxD motif